MKSKKKYKKELLKSLKHLEAAESASLRVMTNLMLLKEMKENNIKFKKGDVFSFEDDIFETNIFNVAFVKLVHLKETKILFLS